MLTLPCSDPSFPEPIVLASLNLKNRRVEPVGHFYEDYYINHQNLLKGDYKEIKEEIPSDSKNKSDEGSDDDFDEEKAEFLKNKEKMDHKRKQRQSGQAGDLGKKNHYSLLGLEDPSSTEDQIKKSFRKLSLIYHPDKYDEGKYDEKAKQKWLNLQNAYETLMDKEKRRIYDSTMEFDDTIPEEDLKEHEDFYEVYGPVFRRNSYWSTDQKKVIELGDAKTSINRVKKFYDFWEGFQSWRDFTMEDEYDVMQAESRYEKRWMEKQNTTMKKDLYKEEKKRVWRLVKRARLCDPRIVKHEKDEAEAKENQKKQKDDMKKQRQDAVAQRIQGEKDKADKIKFDAEESKRIIIETKRNYKIVHTAKCNAFKDACATKLGDSAKKYDKWWADEFLKKLNDDQIEKTVDKLNQFDKSEEAIEWFQEFVKIITAPKQKKQEPKKDEKSALEADSTWSKEEITLLTKAILKFPVGQANRWELIGKFIGGKKSLGAVTAMVTDMKCKNLKGPDAIQRQIEKVIAENETKSIAEKAEKETENGEVEWSQTEQKALEKAFKQFSAKLEAGERWTNIASCVGGGKTKKDCLNRVKEIKNKMGKKK